MNARIPGRLMLTLKTGEARQHVHTLMDVDAGVERASTSFLSRPIDAALNRGEGFLATSVYHARASLGQIGDQHRGYDDVEEHLGLSRTYAVQLADLDRTEEVINRLRDLDSVESATFQTLATAPFAMATVQHTADPWAPHDQVHAREAHDLEP